MYPGIKIKFISASFQNTNEPVETKTAGGDMYDVYYNQYAAFNATFPSGVVYNSDPYFVGEPNPYSPGNKAGKDVMSQRILDQTVGPKGSSTK